MNFSIVIVVHIHVLSSNLSTLFTWISRCLLYLGDRRLNWNIVMYSWKNWSGRDVQNSCERHILYSSVSPISLSWWHVDGGTKKRSQRSGFSNLTFLTFFFSDMKWFVTSVKWVCKGVLLLSPRYTCKQGTGNIFVYFTCAISYFFF